MGLQVEGTQTISSRDESPCTGGTAPSLRSLPTRPTQMVARCPDNTPRRECSQIHGDTVFPLFTSPTLSRMKSAISLNEARRPQKKRGEKSTIRSAKAIAGHSSAEMSSKVCRRFGLRPGALTSSSPRSRLISRAKPGYRAGHNGDHPDGQDYAIQRHERRAKRKHFGRAQRPGRLSARRSAATAGSSRR